jgi:DNA-binding NtrC family response regulator
LIADRVNQAGTTGRLQRQDIPLLVRHFINRISAETGKMVRGVSQEAEKLLVDHHWPGNVREPQNAIERAIAIGSSDVMNRICLHRLFSGCNRLKFIGLAHERSKVTDVHRVLTGT